MPRSKAPRNDGRKELELKKYKPLYWLIVTVFLLLFALTEKWIILYVGGAVLLVYLIVAIVLSVKNNEPVKQRKATERKPGSEADWAYEMEILDILSSDDK